MKGFIAISRPEKFFAPYEFVQSLLDLKGEYRIESCVGAIIEENRNVLFEMAKKEDLDWILMIDTDMVFKKDDVDRIIKLGETYDVVAGVTMRGYPPYWPSLYNFIDPVQKLIEVPKEPRFVEGCGMAFTLIGKKAIQQLELRPFDRLLVNRQLLGEDLSFCYNAKQKGLKIYCDPSIKVGHLRMTII